MLEQLPTDKLSLYNTLPVEFTTSEGITVAQKQNISADSFKRFLADKKENYLKMSSMEDTRS